MRPIDADALIKETTEARCVNCDRRKGMKKGKMTFVYEIGDVPCRACDVMDMIDALDEAPTVGGWISVKDRMPPNDDTKVMTYGNPVTHWMPLPEPPKEDDGK